MAATGLYLLIGIVGFPVFAAGDDGVHRSGLDTIIAVDGGRIVLRCRPAATSSASCSPRRSWARSPSVAGTGGFVTSVAAMVVGDGAHLRVGVVWLAIAIDVSITDALTFGLYPFLPGDIVKLLVAAGLLPLGWRLVSGRASEQRGGSSEPR